MHRPPKHNPYVTKWATTDELWEVVLRVDEMEDLYRQDLSDYTTFSYVDSQLDALTSYVDSKTGDITTDLSNYTTIQYMQRYVQIQLAATSEVLTTDINAAVEDLTNQILELKELHGIDLSGYYNKSEIDTTVAEIEAIIADTKSELETSIASTKSELETSISDTKAELEASIATKTTEAITSDTGTAYVWNETSGGGARYVNVDGTTSFVGVNNGGSEDITVQIYSKDASTNHGTRLNVYNKGIYYVPNKSTSDADYVADDANQELAVKGDLVEFVTESELDETVANLEEKIATGDADVVKYTDVSTEANPDRKSIVLGNHDLILGTDTNGDTYNLAMLSKWDVADFGSNKVALNLNGLNERPTYNDDYEIALLNDVNEVKSELETSISENKSELEASISETKTELADAKSELEASISNNRSELESSISETKAELETSIADTKSELETAISETQSSLATAKSELETSISDAKSELEATISDAKTELTISISDTKTELEASISETQSDLADAKSDLEAKIATKTTTEISSSTGTSYVWNETSGGGARYVHSDGTTSFIGVNNGGADGVTGDLYSAANTTDWNGSILYMFNEGFYYHGNTVIAPSKNPSLIKNNPDNEIAVKGDIETAISTSESATDAKLALKADLVDGLVPASQLPSYVDDVIEVSELPTEGEAGKIYVLIAADGTSEQYRWSGSQFVLIGHSELIIGTVSGTAFEGSRGAALEEQVSTLEGNLTDTAATLETKIAESATTLEAKIAEVTTTLETKIAEGDTDSVKFTDISTEDNPNRKSIVLGNHDMLLGTDTNGETYNLAMVSKWDVADFGTTNLHLNLNGTSERPTYNDDYEIALLNDVTEAKSDLEAAINAVETGLTESIASTKSELETTIASTKVELETTIDSTKSELETSISDNKSEVEASIAEAKSELETSINTVDSKVDAVDSKVDALEIPSIEGLATESYVDESIAAIEFPVTDLSDYATISYVDGKVSEVDAKIDAIEIPSIEGLASESYVDEKVASIEIPSVEGLASETYVDEKVSEVSAKVDALEIPSIEGLASESYVDEKISEIEIPSVEGLASEAYVDAQIAAIEFPVTDLTDYAKTEDVDAVKTELTESITTVKSELETSVAEKTTTEVTGSTGTAYVWNEASGGGARYVHTDGTTSFIGVNNGGSDGVTGDLYSAANTTDWEGSILYMFNKGFYYHGDTVISPSKNPDLIKDDPTREIAVKGDIPDTSNLTIATITSDTGSSIMQNEESGCGPKYWHTDGTYSYVGVNNGGADDITVQIYSRNSSTDVGTRINVYNKGAFYLPNMSRSDENYEADGAKYEIAVKGDIDELNTTLTTRITSLESEVGELGNVNAEARIAALESEIATLKATIETLTSQIESLI